MPRFWSKIESNKTFVSMYVIENETLTELDLNYDINLQMTPEKNLKMSTVLIKNCPNLTSFNRCIINDKSKKIALFSEIMIENCPKLMHITQSKDDTLTYIYDDYSEYETDGIFYWQYYKLLKFMETNIHISDRITKLEKDLKEITNFIHQPHAVE